MSKSKRLKVRWNTHGETSLRGFPVFVSCARQGRPRKTISPRRYRAHKENRRVEPVTLAVGGTTGATRRAALSQCLFRRGIARYARKIRNPKPRTRNLSHHGEHGEKKIWNHRLTQMDTDCRGDPKCQRRLESVTLAAGRPRKTISPRRYRDHRENRRGDGVEKKTKKRNGNRRRRPRLDRGSTWMNADYKPLPPLLIREIRGQTNPFFPRGSNLFFFSVMIASPRINQHPQQPATTLP